MAMGSGSVSNRKPSKKEGVKGNEKKGSKLNENGGTASLPKRKKHTEIRVLGGRIYDAVNGKTCHQCRQKTMDFVAACKNLINNKRCTMMYCHKCLLNRYGEKAEEVAALNEWTCPRCRDICNCSICMKKRGHQPTGILVTTAKATGFSSVSEMLLTGLTRSSNALCSPKKEVVCCPAKCSKENSLDGNTDATMDTSIQSCDKRKLKQEVHESTMEPSNEETGPHGCVKVTKKKKRVRFEQMNIKENENDITENCVHDDKKQKKSMEAKLKNDETEKNDVALARRTSPRKLNVHESTKEPSDEETGPHDCVKTTKEKKRVKLEEMNMEKNEIDIKENCVRDDDKKQKKSMEDKLEHDTEKNDVAAARRTSPRKLHVSTSLDDEVKLKTAFDLDKTVTDNNTTAEKKCVDVKKNFEVADWRVNIQLPVGVELSSVAGIDMQAQDVGNALQFLEFCAVFGKVLHVRKRQPEHVLHDLLHGRDGRRAKFSLAVQFHINLLSIILSDRGEKCVKLNPSHGKDSWFNALKKCLPESESAVKLLGLESFDTADNYETLEPSAKLKLLNFLCDEALETDKLRAWMVEQDRGHAEKVKEAKQKVTAAKDKEKKLKQKMTDDIAKAIIAKHGAPLSIAEHEAIVSNIKHKVQRAQAKVLESKKMLIKSHKSDATRIEPCFSRVGHAYWKLHCMGKSELVHQVAGKGEANALTLDDEWFVVDDEGNKAIERNISLSKLKA